jgi:CAAX protease family protein
VTFIEQDPAVAPRNGEAWVTKPESAGRMIAIAVGCILLAFVGAIVGGVIMGLAVVAVGGPLATRASTATLLYQQGGIAGTASVLFFSALARARTIGYGDRRWGLGDGPVERLPVVLALAAVMAAYAVLVAVAYYQGHPDRVARMLSANGWLTVTFLAMAVVVAPVAEELFFRGWLWVGLRRHWSVIPTAALTGGLWAALHIESGILRVLLLLPGAVILSAARHYGASVRASIALHALYNIIVLSPPWHLKWLGLM